MPYASSTDSNFSGKDSLLGVSDGVGEGSAIQTIWNILCLNVCLVPGAILFLMQKSVLFS